MRTLVAYHSHSGHTRRAAEALAERIGADLVEVRPADDRFRGLIGLLRAVVAARRARPAPIAPLDVRLEDYDLVVVGTPIWASHISPPAREFLMRNRERLRDYATLYTCAGTALPEAGEDMARIMGPSPRAVLDLTRRDEGTPAFDEKLATFAREIGAA